MPSLTADIRHRSPRATGILEAIRTRIYASRSAYAKRHQLWKQNEESALAYIPESELDRIRRLEREIGGRPSLTTIVIPYSYGVLMASHTYWTTVFLSRNPVNQFAGRHGEGQQQVQAIEALIDYQVQVGEMLVPYHIWLLDAGKYGLGVVNVHWSEEFTTVSQIEEVESMFLGVIPQAPKKKKINRRIKGYSGNRLTNIRPYDFYPDPTVPVRYFQKGEFCGCRIDTSMANILRRVEQGYYIEDTVKMMRDKKDGRYYPYGRVDGSPQIQLPQADEIEDTYGSWDDGGMDRKGKNTPNNKTVSLYETCVNIIPSEWQLGSSDMMEKWIFTTDSEFHHLLGAQPLGANHDKFPFSVLEYEPEGYGIASRGIGEVLKPINDAMDWLINSHLFNVRKALNDQFIVDPSAIEIADLENPLPGGAIRLAPGAYGTDTRLPLTQLPVQDVTRTHLSDMSALLSIGQRTTGVSDQLMGQLAESGRRSATEIRTSSGFGINRLKTNTEYFSAMGWSPLAAMMVQNTQQYYDQEQKFKIVGTLAAQAGQEFININPEMITGFYDFVPVDGTQPVDRMAQAQLWQQLMGQMVNFPELLANYDMGKIFEWVSQLAGLKNISQFRLQLTPDEQFIRELRAGNGAPLGGPNPPTGPAGSSPSPVQTPGSSGPTTGPPPPVTNSGGPTNLSTAISTGP